MAPEPWIARWTVHCRREPCRDLSVDGTTIEIQRLADVVYVGRPVFGQPNSQVSLFKLDEDGKGASRVTVKLGRSSVNTIRK